MVMAVMLTWLTSVEAFGQPNDRRFLAADASQRADLQNIQITNHQAEYVGQAFDLDQPWEQDLRVNYPGSTVWDSENNEYRMYYEVVIGGDRPNSESLIDRHLALATSPDGINWTRPALNITGSDYSDSPQNNFVSIAGTTFANGATVFIDPTASGDQRYKITYRDFQQSGGLLLITGISSDGLNFRPVGQIDDLTDRTRGFDSQNVAFWDPIDSQYKSYARVWYNSPDRRGVVLHANDTWEGTWDANRQLILDPDSLYNDGANTQLYTPGISPYHGQYIGLPSVYHEARSDGRISTGLLHSADGENFVAADSAQDFFDTSVHSPNGDDFQLYAQPTIIEREDDLLFYYSYLDQNHEAADEVFIDLDYQSDLHIARLRRDGFTSFDSVGSETATWLTDVISLTSDADFLELNAIIDGNLTAEVLDAQTLEVISGFSLAQSSELSAGDWLDGQLRWSGVSLSDLSGEDVRFRFHFEDSSVFSFTITASEPSTGVLKGDTNLDGAVDFLDIAAFIAVLGGGGYQAEADADCNGVVDFRDIAAFIVILTNN